MQITGIEAYEGRWEENSILTIGKTYQITTTSKLAEAPQQDIWFTNVIDDTLLYQGDIIEAGPATGMQDTERVIVFQVKEILPTKNILTNFPEGEYPQELNNEFEGMLDGRSWFSNKLIISKIATGYRLFIDYYGNSMAIFATEYEGKMYAWLTSMGFGLCRCYFGKYLLPAWIKDMIDHPEEDAGIIYDEDGEWY